MMIQGTALQLDFHLISRDFAEAEIHFGTSCHLRELASTFNDYLLDFLRDLQQEEFQEDHHRHQAVDFQLRATIRSTQEHVVQL